jgi:hypothetical protein
VGNVSGAGMSGGPAAWCSRPVSARWNEADMKKIGWSCWSATERRTENECPSRMFSTV